MVRRCSRRLQRESGSKLSSCNRSSLQLCPAGTLGSGCSLLLPPCKARPGCYSRLPRATVRHWLHVAPRASSTPCRVASRAWLHPPGPPMSSRFEGVLACAFQRFVPRDRHAGALAAPRHSPPELRRAAALRPHRLGARTRFRSLLAEPGLQATVSRPLSSVRAQRPNPSLQRTRFARR